MIQQIETKQVPKDGYPDHPTSMLFPMMDGKEFDEFACDIEQNGLREEIVLLDGKVIEGRNRQRAALLKGVRPRYRAYDPERDGNSPVTFVVSKNMHRRHLSTSQRAAIAAELVPMFEEEAREWQKATRSQGHVPAPVSANLRSPADADESSLENGLDPAGETQARRPCAKSAGQAAKIMRVGTRSVETAMRVKKEDPNAFEEVKVGNKSVHAALIGKPTAGSIAAEQYENAVKRIEEICGPSQAKAIRDGDILRNRKEVVAYAALTKDKMLAIRALIDRGWSVKKASLYKAENLEPTHTIRQAMHRAVLAGGSYAQKVHDESGGIMAEVLIKLIFGATETRAEKSQESWRAE